MQAIRTRYYGPTNSKGSCIRAKCENGAITWPYDHALDSDGNHEAAKDALIKKLGWGKSRMVVGHFDGDCYWVDVK